MKTLLFVLLACVGVNAQDTAHVGLTLENPNAILYVNGLGTTTIGRLEIIDTAAQTRIDQLTLCRLYPSIQFEGPQKTKWYDFKAYRIKGQGKQAIWSMYALAGILHGGREAFHAEPDVFEKRFGFGRESWFGRDQWKRQYYNNNPDEPHKPEIFNTFRDYYHFSGTAKSGLWVGGAFYLGTTKQPIKYKILDILISSGITVLTANITYQLLRH